MAYQRLTLSAGSTVSNVVRLPAAFQNWTGQGMACLLNFSGQGAASSASSPAGVGNVTLQVSGDPNANPTGAYSAQQTARWNNHDTLVNLSADKNSSIVYQCQYARLVGTVSSGTVTCDIGYADTSTP